MSLSLSKEQRDKLPASDFAFPETRRLALIDERHVRMAWGDIDRVKASSDAERDEARSRILARAKALGIDTTEWERLRAAAGDVEIDAMVLEAMSLSIPKNDNHPNKMPFKGILTRIGVPSDKPPGGSGGRRIMLSAAAAEAALPSLLGMGVGRTEDFDGHDVQAKIGLITDARIEGDALWIEGFVYAADFPQEAARIQKEKDRLGFSFEAQKIRVASLDGDPLVVTACTFTGAAILFKDKAAYTSTQLAASAADRKPQMDDDMKKAIAAAVGEGVGAAVAPLTERLTKIEASQAEIAKRHADHAAIAAKVEPIAADLEKMAASMEANGIGGADALRAQAANMRIEAAAGRMPTLSVPAATPAAAAAPKFEDSEAFKTMQRQFDDLKASAEKTAKEAADAAAAAETKIKDLQAKAEKTVETPDRKTLTPQITRLLAKHDITLEDGKKMSMGQIDGILAKCNLDPTQRIATKTAFADAGLMEGV